MPNSTSSFREEDVRESEGQNPPDAEGSFGDILNQFEQTHTHEAPGDKGIEATVVAVREDKVFFDIGQKTEGVIDASALRDSKGLIELKPGDTVQVATAGRNEEGYIQLSLIKSGAARRTGRHCSRRSTRSWRFRAWLLRLLRAASRLT